MASKEDKVQKAKIEKINDMKDYIANLTSKRINDAKERQNRGKLTDKFLESAKDKNEKEELEKMANEHEKELLRSNRKRYNVNDFQTLAVIGKGAFGEVRVVRQKDSKDIYAMKSLLKSEILQKQQVTHVRAEKDLLASAKSDWLVQLYFSFQDNTYLYFVMEYCPGGDL
eukprot:UN30331